MNKIALADKLIWVGHCDFQPRTWHNHNLILSPAGPLKLVVPVHKGKSINETVPLQDGYWIHSHLQSIIHSYQNRPYFKQYYPELEAALLGPWPSLSDLNISLARVLMHWLQIDTPDFRSEELAEPATYGRKTKLLYDLCRMQQRKDVHYLSSPGETYVDKEVMNGFAHSFQQFEHPKYEQGRKTFTPGMSVIDLIFNCGPRAGGIVRGCGHVG